MYLNSMFFYRQIIESAFTYVMTCVPISVAGVVAGC